MDPIVVAALINAGAVITVALIGAIRDVMLVRTSPRRGRGRARSRRKRGR